MAVTLDADGQRGSRQAGTAWESYAGLGAQDNRGTCEVELRPSWLNSRNRCLKMCKMFSLDLNRKGRYVTQNIYAEFIKVNPWPVEFEESVKPTIADYAKHMPTVIGVLEKVVSELETFPPNPEYFRDPRPSMHDMRIWLTVSDGRLRFNLKVEYRLDSKACYIVDFRPKS